MKKLQGIVTAMVTPFDGSDGPDLDAVRQLTDFLIDRGVNCLYPTGTTGEMYLLSLEERKRIAATVIEQARGRVTVYIHVGAMTLKDTIDLARHACSAGADGIGVVTPTFFGVTDREMEAYYVDVANSVPADFPVYLYNIPQLSGNDLKPATIARVVSRCANVVGIKYSYADMLRVNDYLKIRDGAFSVLIGADRLLVPGLAMGCDGTVSGVACVCPEPIVGVYRAYRAGRQAEALKLQAGANEVAELLRNGSNMAVFKAALKARGIAAGHMRRPLMDLPQAEAEELASQLGKLLGQLGIPLR
jgi:dihydrodipicolinate synthase/N-acetylneuraminate lyase